MLHKLASSHLLLLVASLSACAPCPQSASTQPEAATVDPTTTLPAADSTAATTTTAQAAGLDTASATDPAALLARADRLEADRSLDEVRHTLQVLPFLQLAPGQQVFDYGSGSGYSAELIARTVGDSGRVWAQNPPQWREFAVDTMNQRVTPERLPNVQVLYAAFDEAQPSGPASLDLVTNFYTYHDINNLPVDRAKMNREIFNALKPGGLYVVADHHSAAGAGLSATETLHRIEESVVIQEITAAGFELVEKSNVLADPNDQHTTMAFGRPQPVTDRFLLKFRRPQ